MKYLENEHDWNIHVKNNYGHDAYVYANSKIRKHLYELYKKEYKKEYNSKLEELKKKNEKISKLDEKNSKLENVLKQIKDALKKFI